MAVPEEKQSALWAGYCVGYQSTWFTSLGGNIELSVSGTSPVAREAVGCVWGATPGDTEIQPGRLNAFSPAATAVRHRNVAPYH
jgi:hypothetical protein